MEELGFVSNDKFQASFVSLLVRVYHQLSVTPFDVYTLCSESCCKMEAPPTPRYRGLKSKLPQVQCHENEGTSGTVVIVTKCHDLHM